MFNEVKLQLHFTVCDLYCVKALTISPTSRTYISTDVEIGLEMTSYTVQEDGISVEVCVRLQRGRLEREVEVDLLIADDTALSKYSHLLR